MSNTDEIQKNEAQPDQSAELIDVGGPVKKHTKSKDKKFSDCVRRLLSHRFLVEEKNGFLFKEIEGLRTELNIYLAKLHLEVVIHEASRVIELKDLAQENDDDKISQLGGRAVTFSGLETSILLFLRKRRAAFVYGDGTTIAMVEHNEIRDAMSFTRGEGVRVKKFDQEIFKALERLKEHQVIRGLDDMAIRYQITGVVEVMVPADLVASMSADCEAWWKIRLSKNTDAADEESESEAEAESESEAEAV